MGAPRGQGTPPPPQVSSECSCSSMLWFATLRSVQRRRSSSRRSKRRGTWAAYTAADRDDQTSFGTPPFTALAQPTPSLGRVDFVQPTCTGATRHRCRKIAVLRRCLPCTPPPPGRKCSAAAVITSYPQARYLGYPQIRERDCPLRARAGMLRGRERLSAKHGGRRARAAGPVAGWRLHSCGRTRGGHVGRRGPAPGTDRTVGAPVRSRRVAGRDHSRQHRCT